MPLELSVWATRDKDKVGIFFLSDNLHTPKYYTHFPFLISTHKYI